MALPEKTLVWCAIRDSVTDMHRFKYIFFVNLRFSSRAGVNSIAVLLWSQGRSLEEVTRTSLGFSHNLFVGMNYILPFYFNTDQSQVQKRLVEIRNMPHVGRVWGRGRNKNRGQRITEVCVNCTLGRKSCEHQRRRALLC